MNDLYISKSLLSLCFTWLSNIWHSWSPHCPGSIFCPWLPGDHDGHLRITLVVPSVSYAGFSSPQEQNDQRLSIPATFLFSALGDLTQSNGLRDNQWILNIYLYSHLHKNVTCSKLSFWNLSSLSHSWNSNYIFIFAKVKNLVCLDSLLRSPNPIC